MALKINFKIINFTLDWLLNGKHYQLLTFQSSYLKVSGRKKKDFIYMSLKSILYVYELQT